MALPIPTTLGVLLAKIEGTFGTKETLTNAAAGFRTRNHSVKTNGNRILIPAATGRGDIGGVPGAYSTDLNFDIDLYGGSWADIFLPACGWTMTAASTGVPKSFAPTDDSTKWKTLTAQLQYGTAKLDQCFAAMGTFSLKLTPGNIGTASFKFKGVSTAGTTGIATSGVTFDTSLPAPFMAAAAFTLGSDASIPCTSITFEQDDYVILVPSPDVAGGYLHAWLKKPAMRLKIDPLENSTKDWLADYIAATSVTTNATAVLNGGTGNKISLIVPANQLTLSAAPDRQERDEQLAVGLEFAVLNNSVKLQFE